MSGGHFSYQQHHLMDIHQELLHVVKTNDSDEKNDYGDSIGRYYKKEVLEKLSECAEQVRELYHRICAVDYLLAGDHGEESFLEAYEEASEKDLN